MSAATIAHYLLLAEYLRSLASSQAAPSLTAYSEAQRLTSMAMQCGLDEFDEALELLDEARSEAKNMGYDERASEGQFVVTLSLLAKME